MTSDAKIGLLLGLVFIFVIAFIINGLPNLKPQTTKADVTTNMVSLDDDQIGLVDRERNAQDVLNWEELVDRQGAGLNEAEPAFASKPSVAPSDPQVAVDTGGQDVRSVLPLPSEETVGRLARGFENVVKSLTEASKATVAQQTTTEPAPVIEPPQPKLAPKHAEATEVATAEKLRAVIARSAPRTYVVVDGDNLAEVAKKVYGAQEGNRMVNVKRIYEANRHTLTSPDEIYIGQKLAIPPLADPESKKKDTDTALFEKVQSIGRQHLDAGDKPQPESRYYLVQDGDSLWKIAALKLGSGARYEEIAKLNADLLKDKNSLDIGMRLRMPSK